MTGLQELIIEFEELKKTKLYENSFKAIDDCIFLTINKLEKEKQYLEYFFNNNDYNTDFTDFEDQYEYLTLCSNISERRMCNDCSIEFGPCKLHLSVYTSNGI
jgi:hypothetical protein